VQPLDDPSAWKDYSTTGEGIITSPFVPKTDVTAASLLRWLPITQQGLFTGSRPVHYL